MQQPEGPGHPQGLSLWGPDLCTESGCACRASAMLWHVFLLHGQTCVASQGQTESADTGKV